MINIPFNQFQHAWTPPKQSLSIFSTFSFSSQILYARLLSSLVPRRKPQFAPGTLINLISVTSGIGLESSLLFAAEGANVLLVDINLEGTEKGAALIKQRYPNVKALAVKADVGKEADVKNAVDTAVKEFGRLDVMVSSFRSIRMALGAEGARIVVQQCW